MLRNLMIPWYFRSSQSPDAVADPEPIKDTYVALFPFDSAGVYDDKGNKISENSWGA